FVIDSGTLDIAIPDGDAGGSSHTLTISPPEVVQEVTTLTLMLQIAGDFVGDLFAEVTHNGRQAVLLNRVGRTASNSLGYGDTGLNVVLTDSAQQGDIHNYRVTISGNPNTPLPDGTLTGIWSPDGRNANPPTVLDTTSRPSM